MDLRKWQKKKIRRGTLGFCISRLVVIAVVLRHIGYAAPNKSASSVLWSVTHRVTLASSPNAAVGKEAPYDTLP